MWINLISGIFFILLNNPYSIILGLAWILAPSVAWNISKENKNKLDINKKQEKYLKEIGKSTWKFFEDNITKENNYLMIDNYQENRIPKCVHRTSSTNIGLEYISIISSYDLGFISKEKTLEYIKNLTETINKLSKWNGHLYNWYNTITLEPLIPQYVSTVDSRKFYWIFVYSKTIFN